MQTYLQFAVLGLGLGAIYIGLGTGLLLVHRATGIINFAQGAMAMWGAYVFAQLRVDGTLVLPIGSVDLGRRPPVLVAALIGLAMALLLGVLVHYLVFRPVRHAPVLAQVVVSVALMITLQALVVLRFGPNNIEVDSILPDETFALAGTELPLRECLIALVMVVLCIALAKDLYHDPLMRRDRRSARLVEQAVEYGTQNYGDAFIVSVKRHPDGERVVKAEPAPDTSRTDT